MRICIVPIIAEAEKFKKISGSRMIVLKYRLCWIRQEEFNSLAKNLLFHKQ